MKPTLRLAISSIPAAVITVGAVVFMQFLISGGPAAGAATLDAPAIRFHAIDPQGEPPRPRDRELPPPKPPPVKEPPLPQPTAVQTPSPVRAPLNLSAPPLESLSMGSGLGVGCLCADGIFGGEGDGGVVPKVKLTPRYPPAAARAGIEGYVTLTFTVTAEGSVIDPQVIDANPRRVFDDEAIRAVLKWTFAPRVEGGRAVPARVQQTLEFKLDGSS